MTHSAKAFEQRLTYAGNVRDRFLGHAQEEVKSTVWKHPQGVVDGLLVEQEKQHMEEEMKGADCDIHFELELTIASRSYLQKP